MTWRSISVLPDASSSDMRNVASNTSALPVTSTGVADRGAEGRPVHEDRRELVGEVRATDRTVERRSLRSRRRVTVWPSIWKTTDLTVENWVSV